MDIVIARAIHVLAIVHWIGGVFMVTAVILPSVRRLETPERRIAAFEAIEGRFSRQAKISVTLAGLSGLYLTDRLNAWHRFLEVDVLWMHAMVLIWAVFTFVLFVAEPLVLHAWFRRKAQENPERVFALIQRAHVVLLTASLVTVGAAVLYANGFYL
ncbi:hypothetical protein [Roseospira visakhapatnamensis]|uniref:Putative membrane protein n=1 Tax=Roseospira visakhapatnamensis TaxID=390880 RepID=A0A7W6W8J8_9PROT|nr:hypothetical protein [Roseospira visakhapatnamensis]MBB4264903.1 putative membrane protein [Roseospira visakhapatnamensis]